MAGPDGSKGSVSSEPAGSVNTYMGVLCVFSRQYPHSPDPGKRHAFARGTLSPVPSWMKRVCRPQIVSTGSEGVSSWHQTMNRRDGRKRTGQVFDYAGKHRIRQSPRIRSFPVRIPGKQWFDSGTKDVTLAGGSGLSPLPVSGRDPWPGSCMGATPMKNIFFDRKNKKTLTAEFAYPQKPSGFLWFFSFLG